MNSFRKKLGQLSLTPACAVAVLVISIAAMFPVWKQLLTIALRDEESSHLLLVPFVFGWLIWCLRDRIQTRHVTRPAWGFALIGLSFVLQEVGLRYSLQILWHASAVVCLVGAIWLIVGLDTVRSIWPALAVLLFLIPVPGLLRQQISLPLQMCSASVTEQLLSFAGTNIQRHGCVLSVDGTVVTVAEACNGMRMLFAVLLVVYAMAFSLCTRRSTQATILILSPILAILLNVVRLSISVWMFGACTEETAVRWHDVNGWLIPGILMLAIILFTDNAQDTSEPTPAKSPVWSYGPARGQTAIALVLFCLCFAVNVSRVPGHTHTAQHRSIVSQEFSEFPYCIGDWLGVSGSMHREEVGLLKPVSAFRREYSHVDGDERLSVVAVFTGDARDLVGHEPGICFSGQGWEILQQHPVKWHLGDVLVSGRDYRFRFGRAQDAQKQVVSILLVAGGQSSGDMKTVAEAAADFRRAPYGACSLQISSDTIRSDAEWTQITQQFVREMRPLVDAFATCQPGPGQPAGLGQHAAVASRRTKITTATSLSGDNVR